MKKNKRILAGLLAAVTASTMMLTGCGGDKAADAGAPAADTPESAGQADKDPAGDNTASSDTGASGSESGEQTTIKIMHKAPSLTDGMLSMRSI